MNQLYQNIINKDNCVIESPTGTGKSLMILSVLKQLHQNTQQTKQIKVDQQSKLPQWFQEQSAQLKIQQQDNELKQINDTIKFFKMIREFPSDLNKMQIQEYISMIYDLNQCNLLDLSNLSETVIENVSQLLMYQFENKQIQTTYASRTHSQLIQFNQNIQSYSKLSSITLASRQLYCIHQDMAKSDVLKKVEQQQKILDMEDVDVFCKEQKSCYFKKFEIILKAMNKYYLGSNQQMNIYELKQFGIEQQACPYYLSLIISKLSNIVLTTQIQLTTKENVNYNANNNLIIDEAHNMSEIIQNSYQSQINVINLIIFNYQLDIYLHKQRKFMNIEQLQQLQKLQQFIFKFLRLLNHCSQSGQLVLVREKLFDQLKQFKLNIIITDILQMFKEQRYQYRIKQNMQYKLFYQIVMFLELLCNVDIQQFILTLNKQDDDQESYINSQINCQSINTYKNKEEYVKYIQYQQQDNTQYIDYFKIFDNCINYKIQLSHLQPQFTNFTNEQFYNIQMLGGTISPFEQFSQYFVDELNLQFQQFDHIIDVKKQLKMQICSSLNNQQLVFNYQKQQDQVILKQLFDKIVNIRNSNCYLQPHQNMIVFFPSYNVLNCFKQLFSNFKGCIINNYKKNLQVSELIEKTTRLTAQQLVATFEQPKINMEFITESCRCFRNHILFGVTSGTLAEGIDFKDDLCRLLIILGVPFPNQQDLFIQEKQKINTHYSLQKAFKAVNQCIGRCIRWREDWSSVILVDDRYCKYFGINVSKWIAKGGFTKIEW